MASIVKRLLDMRCARYRYSAAREDAPHFARELDAQRWLYEVTSQILTGAYVDPSTGKVTFAECWAARSTRQTWTHSTRETADLLARTVTLDTSNSGRRSAAHIEERFSADPVRTSPTTRL